MPLVAQEEQLRRKSIISTLAEDNAVGPSGEALRRDYLDEYVRRVWVSIFKKEQALLSSARQHLWTLTSLQDNWDSYGAPAPNDRAAANAERVLRLLQYFELSIARVLPSAEGGIGICFIQNDSYADIECSNDGEIIGVRYVGAAAPTLIEIDGTDDSIRAGLQEVREHFGA
jgi:hypothetical protein